MTGSDWKAYRAYCKTPEQRRALREMAAEYYRAINARKSNMRLMLLPMWPAPTRSGVASVWAETTESRDEP